MKPHPTGQVIHVFRSPYEKKHKVTHAGKSVAASSTPAPAGSTTGSTVPIVHEVPGTIPVLGGSSPCSGTSTGSASTIPVLRGSSTGSSIRTGNASTTPASGCSTTGSSSSTGSTITTSALDGSSTSIDSSIDASSTVPSGGSTTGSGMFQRYSA